MARFVAKLDMSEWQDLIQYVGEVASDWPKARREAFRLEMLAALESGIDVFPEKGCFVVQPNGKLFAILNRYGLNPVC